MKKKGKPTPSVTIFNGKETYYIVDLGALVSPRFELYSDLESKPIKKSNDPREFDYVFERKETV